MMHTNNDKTNTKKSKHKTMKPNTAKQNLRQKTIIYNEHITTVCQNFKTYLKSYETYQKPTILFLKTY